MELSRWSVRTVKERFKAKALRFAVAEHPMKNLSATIHIA
jgi:hypothetical protein